ncbi:hypothetical protein [Gorillibacterium massiliense]|uniref:hypothetical protein n=1 Tax=Gorillibacterium massiliense TaxID=1280390 RepID=UPI0004BCF257|nr:hypothetical protein [Gorillibacterium massiliense]
MNKKDYKRLFDQVEPDAAFKERLEAKMNNQTRVNRRRFIPVAAACLALVAALAIYGSMYLPGKQSATPTDQPSSMPSPAVTVTPSQQGAVVIPQMELPKQTGAAMDMIGLVVYKGKIYTQTGTTVAGADAKALLGEKIGTAKGNINEWSTQDAYATELASTVGGTIYTIKGYDSSFRLISYTEQNGEVWADILECLNGITVTKGADVFGKLHLAGNVQSAEWETFDSWNEGKGIRQTQNPDIKVDGFLQALDEATPLPREEKLDELLGESGENQKFLTLKLKDQTMVTLRLFKDGYIMYGNAAVLFKTDAPAFAELWNQL